MAEAPLAMALRQFIVVAAASVWDFDRRAAMSRKDSVSSPFALGCNASVRGAVI